MSFANGQPQPLPGPRRRQGRNEGDVTTWWYQLLRLRCFVSNSSNSEAELAALSLKSCCHHHQGADKQWNSTERLGQGLQCSQSCCAMPSWEDWELLLPWVCWASQVGKGSTAELQVCFLCTHPLRSGSDENIPSVCPWLEG